MRTRLALGLCISVSSSMLATGCDYGLSTADGPLPVERLRIADPRDGRSLVVSWQAPDSEDFDGVRVVRKIGGEPRSDTDGDLVYEGDEEKLTDLLCERSIIDNVEADRCVGGVDASPPYLFGAEVFYAVFAIYDGSDLSEPVREREVVGYLQPPEFVSALSSAGVITATWFGGGGGRAGEVAHWHVVAKRGTAAPSGPDDGDTVADVDVGVDRFEQSAAAGETWTFVVYGKAADGTLSAASEPVTATAAAGGPEGLSAIVGAAGPAPKGKVSLSWQNPAGTSGDWRVVIVRRADVVPTHEGDGVVVYEGTAESAEDFFPPVDADGDVHYRPFGCDASGCEAGASATARLAVTATAGRVLTGAVTVRTAARAGADLVVGGDLEGSVSFGGVSGTGEAGGSGFVARLGPDGSPRWMRTFITPGNDDGADGSSVRSVAVAGDDTFVAGSFFGTLKLDGDATAHAGPVSLIGQFDDGAPFLMKLDGDGQPVFVVPPDSGLGNMLDDIEVLPLADGGALLTRVTNSFSLSVSRISPTGAITWRTTGFGAGGATYPFSAAAKAIVVTGDNEVAVLARFRDSFEIGGQTFEAPNTEERLMALRLALDTGDVASVRVIPLDADLDDAVLLADGAIGALVRPNGSPVLAGVTIDDAFGLVVIEPDDTIRWAASFGNRLSRDWGRLAVDGDALLLFTDITTLHDLDVRIERGTDVFGGFEDPVKRVDLLRFAAADGGIRSVTTVCESQTAAEPSFVLADAQGLLLGANTEGSTRLLAGTSVSRSVGAGGIVLEAELP